MNSNTPSTPSLVSITHRHDVAVLTLDNPPVNALSRAVRSELLASLHAACADARVRAIVLTCAGRTFIAGADIGEFADRSGTLMTTDPDPNTLIEAIDNASKPVVAALFGSVLGGGLELALGCHARVARAGTRLGLPEVTLGVVPGAGGTQRLPRLVGIPLALKMITTGMSLDADAALDAGLIDALVARQDDLLAQAIEYALSLADAGKLPRVRDRQVEADANTDALFAQERNAPTRQRGQALARSAAIDCVEAVVKQSFDAALAFERAHFVACNASPQAAALQHAFFARRAATRIAGVDSDTTRRNVQSVGILGGGTMGRGIAMAFANAGLPVSLLEVDERSRDAALTAIAGEYARGVKAGRLDQARADACVALITGYTDDLPLRQCDLVLEAVYENLDIKLDVCERLGRIARPGAIIATNTSTLDVDLLAAATGRPEDVVGLHFFSPANIMKLLEVVRGKATTPEVLASMMALAGRIGKVSVVSGVCYGFIGNRMLEGYLREAEAMLLEGLTPRRIDSALESFGMAMGPCRMMDLAGVDVCAKVVAERGKEGKLPADPLYRIVCRELSALGRFGQKTRSGFYRYEDRAALDDPAVTAICAQLAERHGVTPPANPVEIGDDEIVERCLLPLINEGAQILDEGIAARQSDLDVVWLEGYGFPAERGGPMHYADSLGRASLPARLQAYAKQRGNAYGYWTPAASLGQTS
jgi:3-hydroxyacyl-CoA dehydrogenase